MTPTSEATKPADTLKDYLLTMAVHGGCMHAYVRTAGTDFTERISKQMYDELGKLGIVSMDMVMQSRLGPIKTAKLTSYLAGRNPDQASVLAKMKPTDLHCTMWLTLDGPDSDWLIDMHP